MDKHHLGHLDPRKRLSRKFESLFFGDFSSEGIECAAGCNRMAGVLFSEISRIHGKELAHAIFYRLGSPPTARVKAEWSRYALLDRLDFMSPKPNVYKLAREVAAENKLRAAGERVGPRGSTDPETIERYLRNLVKERRDAMARGTWAGPYTPTDVG